ncbi:MAG: DUF4336 domain-containing protein [Kamptonema sp. SIO4C4]|nr:DUF4336 domain-containing protein [Kamptonema sp. SIO4C4]
MTATPLSLYEPINVLKPVAENLWIVDGPIVRMAYLAGTSIPFTTRMTVVRLQNGQLWCHSPIQLTEDLKAQIDTLGPVGHLVSPNKIHYAHIQSWAEAYPNAMTWASPGVRERAARQQISVQFQADLEDNPPPQWAEEFEQLIFRGSRFLEEVVFFHRPSTTLILADLIENFEPQKTAAPLRWLTQLTGCADPDGKMPLDLRSTFWGNKAQARACAQHLIAWQPEKVILSHGRWYPEKGTAELKRAFRWLGAL